MLREMQRNVRRDLAILGLLVITLTTIVKPAAAVFFGQDTPPYDDKGEDNPANFDTVSADADDGECELKVEPQVFPWYYWTGTWSAAWVAHEESMSETVTQTWYMIANWDIDARLGTGDYATATLSIVLRLYDANEVKLEEHTIWSESVFAKTSGWYYEDWNEDGESAYASFTQNLNNGYTYKFAVAFKIYIDTGTLHVDLNSDSTPRSNPALLEINSITWTTTPPG